MVINMYLNKIFDMSIVFHLKYLKKMFCRKTIILSEFS